jgi:hypothetical protein
MFRNARRDYYLYSKFLENLCSKGNFLKTDKCYSPYGGSDGSGEQKRVKSRIHVGELKNVRINKF